jgi:DNA-binding MarR family transcriptional regulator
MAESIADLQDALLRALLMPDQSMADLANACGGDKSKAQRVLKRLEKDKLVTTKRGVATLTEAGKTAANGIKAANDHLATVKAIKDYSEEFDEHEIEFGRAAVAMMKAGYTPERCHWMVTGAMVAFRQMAAVQARRNGLHLVDAVPSGAHMGARRSRRKRPTGGLRVIDPA